MAALLPEGTAIWAMVETPTAVFDVRAIAAHPQVQALVLGTNDLAKELRAALAPGRAALLPHLATALLGGREAGIAVLDGVWNDVRDLEGFEDEARQGVALGFDGKTLVHPTQVEVANRLWAPSPRRSPPRAPSCRPSRRPSGTAAVSSSSTAAWWRTCTATTPCAPLPPRTRSPPRAEQPADGRADGRADGVAAAAAAPAATPQSHRAAAPTPR